MRKAVIDLGTNTFNLLIADVNETSFELVYTTKIGVGIGLGGINKNTLTLDAQERAIDALSQFKALCDQHQVTEIKAIGTSAIRDAENANEFIQKVLEKLQFEIQIISGDTEAQLIYQGVLWTYDFEQEALIMDIGGGSTEFILANSNGIQQKISLNIGISRIFQAIKTSDPLSDQDIENIENWLEKTIGKQLDTFHCKRLIGASGSFETFYEMIHLKAYELEQTCYNFPSEELIKILNWLIESNQEEREAHPHIIPIRKMMGPITAVKTKWILKKLGVEEIWMSPYSMKEGALTPSKLV